MKPRRRKTSMFAHNQDVISNIPDNVVTNIMDRLPIQDAVKTSVLSRNWRFKWTMLLSQLMFDEDFFHDLKLKLLGYYLFIYIFHLFSCISFFLERIMAPRRHKTSKFAHNQDVISNMPDNVVTNILDRLPIQDAVMTSVLSRNWRFKWTMLLSQLLFDNEFFNYIEEKIGYNDNHVRIIIRTLLLQLRGTVTKCVLHAADNNFNRLVEDEDINHLISFLSRKGIKELTIKNQNTTPVNLPTHLFSCLELKHLDADVCRFNPPPGSHGFPNLLSLNLGGETSELGEFITRCPLLEILNLHASAKVNFVDIAKLKNLKVLSLSLKKLDTTAIISVYDIFELLGSLPKLQQLELNFAYYKLTEGGAKKKFPAAFLSLKALVLHCIDMGNGIQFSFAFELIRNSPNLQTLEITSYNHDTDPISMPEVEYNTTGLRSVELKCLEGLESEVCLIKYLLGSSPFLKRMLIHHNYSLSLEEKFKFAWKLLKLHRASPVVDIDLYRF